MTSEPLLTFDDVIVSYPGMDRPALGGVSLEVRPGERVALVGPSGAGKSTVLALAAGLTLPTSGRVDILGVDSTRIGRRAHRDTRARIGIVSQDYALVGPLRVATNVAAGRLGRWSWPRAMQAIVRPGPIDDINRSLDAVGIAHKVWERTDQLSGGEQQRTAIARTLFQGPDVLLADEPVSALDPARSEAVMAVLAEEAATGGRALVTSMHDAPLALRHCDRIVALRLGEVQFDLPAHEVTEERLTELYLIDDHGTADAAR
ncbi:MAG: ATP-binding cassette domain-containing protein [Actinomycetota bacterium]